MSGVEPVTLYVAEGCRHCEAAAEDLRMRGVRFRKVDVAADPSALDELKSVTPERRLPVFVDHERVSVGWQGGSTPFERLGLE